MNWKFWQKENPTETSSGGTKVHFEKPRDLPQEIGRHLVVVQGLDPDWIWSLKCLRIPRENAAGCFDIRIYSPETMVQHNVKVKNYTSLDDHMDLVIFAGWYDKKTQALQIDRLIKEVV